ncbi:hypothetical protein M5689_024421 [Euphorbia peplus]|nr:hypothetical protein M5689_024421 [Euphorbia peplus]
MKAYLISSCNSFHAVTHPYPYPIPFPRCSKSVSFHSISLPPRTRRCTALCFSKPTTESGGPPSNDLRTNLNMQVGNQIVPSFLHNSIKLSSADQAFFLLSFIACTTSVAFTSLVIAAIPTLNAMRRAAISLSKLADTAREELPSTMASIRLSGMEISDLTLELSDLSQEVADGVKKSAQAVQAAEAGVRQIGALAHHHTISMIQERASLPIISLRPVVAGAAKKTSNVVGQATKNLMNMISRGGELSRENEDSHGIERLDI